MKKRLILSTIFSAAVLGLLFFLSSCQQGSQPADSIGDKYDAVIFNVPNENSVEYPIFEDASIDHAMIMCPPVRGGNKNNHGNGKGMGMGYGNMDSKNIPLGKIMRDMKLSDDQLNVIKTYILLQSDCFKTTELKYRTERIDTLTVANDARKLILDSLKNGLIDRTQAMKDLILLNAETRAKLAPIDSAMSADLKLCLCDLITQITTFIDNGDGTVPAGTDKQKEQWAKWIVRYKNYCKL